MKPNKISFAKTTRRKPMENTPVNPETIVPEDKIPAMLTPGEQENPAELAENY